MQVRHFALRSILPPLYPNPQIRTRQSAVIREAPADTSQTFGNTSRRV